MPKLPNNKPHQSPKQSHAEDHTEQIEPKRGDHRRRTGGFRAGRSTTEQVLNLRILCEKYLQHQQDLYFVFNDFKKAFDRVWQTAVWITMKMYNISANPIRVIKRLYDRATSTATYETSSCLLYTSDAADDC